MNRRNKRMTSYFILFSLILVLGIVYAILQANLEINGIAKISENQWNVHFDNIVVNPNSVPIGTGDTAATIDPQNNCKIDFSVTLSLPGDFYEFTVDVENDGTIDGMIGTLTKTLKVNGTEVQELPYYLNYDVTYSDGIEIEENHLLAKNTSETYKVRVEFKTDIDELPTGSPTITTSLEPQFIQADSTAIDKPLPAFADDSWDTIISNVQNGTIPDYYTLGSTKTIDMGSFGIQTLRIANNSTPSECSTTGFSQTACGFVLEFVAPIIKNHMNDERTNVGGWCSSKLRLYINNEIYNSLPSNLKNSIISTKVISGYYEGNSDYTCETNDALYLFSSKEVYGTIPIYGNFPMDSKYGNEEDTRQLDYFNSIGVTKNNYSGVIKEYNDAATSWWLRSVTKMLSSSDNYDYFTIAGTNGKYYGTYADDNIGVAPAFRIG